MRAYKKLIHRFIRQKDRIFIIKVVQVHSKPAEIRGRFIIIRQKTLDVKIMSVTETDITKLVGSRRRNPRYAIFC